MSGRNLLDLTMYIYMSLGAKRLTTHIKLVAWLVAGSTTSYVQCSSDLGQTNCHSWFDVVVRGKNNSASLALSTGHWLFSLRHWCQQHLHRNVSWRQTVMAIHKQVQTCKQTVVTLNSVHCYATDCLLTVSFITLLIVKTKILQLQYIYLLWRLQPSHGLCPSHSSHFSRSHTTHHSR